MGIFCLGFEMKFTLLNTPYNLSLLVELGKSTVRQPQISQLVEALYESMFGTVVDGELETERMAVKTRLYSKDKGGIFKGSIIKKKQPVVVTDVLRAGSEPAALFYHKLCTLLEPHSVRQDHIMSQRIESSKGITGTTLMGSKIGGQVKDTIVLIPDPMGATGHSMEEVITHYSQHYGKAKRFVLVNLVVTPFYLDRLKKLKQNIHVYAARMDEKLTKDDFILPGLGGLGEMINNTRK